MKIGDLLDTLREEFALDEAATTLTLAAWQAQPLQPPESLDDMLGFIERSAEAVQIAGLHGLAEFLQYVHGFCQSTAQAKPAPLLRATKNVAWIAHWLGHAQAYLAKPALPEVVQAMCLYYGNCPQSPSLLQVSELATLLNIAPALPQEDAHTEPLPEASAEDVSLALDDVDAGLLDALMADAPQQLERLEETLERWRQAQANEPEMLEAQRIAHTFKGSGNIIGLPGIGRMAHRLEDILEYALDQVRAGHSAPSAMARDSIEAVHCLQHMVSHLQGEEAPPQGAQQTLQKLLGWVQHIRDDSVPSDAARAVQTPSPAVNETAHKVVDTTADEAINLIAAYAQPERVSGTFSSENQANFAAKPTTNTALTVPLAKLAASPTVAAAVTATSAAPTAPATASAEAGEGASLRVSVERMSRLLRRAGQSIVSSQRLAQLLSDVASHIDNTARNQALLATRLRDLETLVGGQAVALREQQEDGDLDPLELDRYDALHLMSRAIAEAAQDGQELLRTLRQDSEHATTLLRDEGYALVEQHRELLQARLVPVKTILPRLRRNVAQTASATGKDVALSVQGEAVTLDADVLSRLTEPLLHLLRNAVDHGIESAPERMALGKPVQGNISVLFSRVGQEVEIVVSDDGQGLNLPAIAQKAQAFGLITTGMQLSDAELRRLILHPGFSTRDTVTEVSGRGVGMDVVNDRIAALKGRLAIDSTAQQGSRFTLHVPASGGVSQALIVQCAGESLALAADQVLNVLYAGQAELVNEGGQWWTLYGSGEELQRYPSFVLGQWLGYEEADFALSRPTVLVKGAEGPVALLVDAVLDTRELILQDIGQLTRRIRGVVAGALRPDGKPLFLIDVAEMERSVRSTKLAPSAALRRRQAAPRTRILVVDDALSVRRAMQQLLQDAGYEVVLANDGFEAIEQLRKQLPALILTDLEMPNLNGLELTRRVRELPLWASLPVVMITSRAGDKHRTLAQEAGVDVYMTKPYLDADLLAHVRQLSQEAGNFDLLL